MAAYPKSMTVYFYAIEPALRSGSDKPTFESGSYPLDTVLATIRTLDPAAEEYRIQDGLFAGETFCVLHENGPQTVMGAYYRDNVSKPLTEYKGEINELFLRDGEALVDAAYAAFFPGDVVGLVRTSSKAPGFAKIGQWLSVLGGYPCALLALRDANALAQLDGHPTGLRRFIMRIRRERIESVSAYSEDVAGALRSASNLNSLSGEIGIELRVRSKEEEAQWSSIVRQEIEDLMGVLPDFEVATVKVAGIKKPLNLIRANVHTTIDVAIIDSKRVGPPEAATALFQAYAQEEHSIKLALEARRGR